MARRCKGTGLHIVRAVTVIGRVGRRNRERKKIIRRMGIERREEREKGRRN
jgi:hypothetical protein